MNGIPHHQHQNCRLMEWKADGKTEHCFSHMMYQFAKLLRPGGILVIHANGSASDEGYDGAIRRQAMAAGLSLMSQDGKVFQKWVK